jgi:hypothetical protein
VRTAATARAHEDGDDTYADLGDMGSRPLQARAASARAIARS